VADEAVEHGPVADPDGECLCLTVTRGPVRFKGILGFLLGPFMQHSPARISLSRSSYLGEPWATSLTASAGETMRMYCRTARRSSSPEMINSA
jgi:hypothetical protein